MPISKFASLYKKVMQKCKHNHKAVITVVLATTLFMLGFLPRLFNKHELAKMHKETSGAIPIVHTVIAHAAPFTETGMLPGNISAIQYATIYARVDGYLKRRLVDIGDHVKAGQLLAEIDTPTVDQELEQARADLVQAKAQLESAKSNLKEAQAKDVAAIASTERSQANESYADVTAKRWVNMAARGAVSLQSRDEKVRAYEAEVADLKTTQAQEKAAQSAVITARSEVDVAQANVTAKQAAVKRFAAQQAFKFVQAPFDGFITARKVDPGALITAGSQTSGLELFQMAKIDLLRTYVNVPQTIARYVKPGQSAEVLVPEFPERVFIGKITNTAGALDPNTRTRQTEIHIDNYDHMLLPGMYAQVKITVKRSESWVRVPGTTLVPRADGMYVVVVRNNKAHYQQVAIGRDFGDNVEIKAGLSNGEIVAISPPVDLREGESVNPQALSDD